MSAKKEKNVVILYIDFTDEEMERARNDLFFALSCVPQYRFIIINKRTESISKEDLIKLLAQIGVVLDIPPSAVKDSLST
jgi:hypothetical protein